MNQIKSKKSDLGWRLCCVAALLLAVTAFSPLVLATGEAGPWLFGLPRTLWSGLLISVTFVLLTFIGAKFHPDRASPEEGDSDVEQS